MANDKSATRRRYSSEMKSTVMAECAEPGASVAKVAMSHGINANVVHGWRKLAREGGALKMATPREFVPVALEPAAMQSAVERGIEVELRRGARWRCGAVRDGMRVPLESRLERMPNQEHGS